MKLNIPKTVLKAAPEVVCTTFPNPCVREYTSPLVLVTGSGSVCIFTSKERELKALTEAGRVVADAIRRIAGVTYCQIYNNTHITINVGVECEFGKDEGIHKRINEILQYRFPNPSEVTFKKVHDGRSDPNPRHG